MPANAKNPGTWTRQHGHRPARITLIIAVSSTFLAFFAFALQPRSLRARYSGWMTTAVLRHADGTTESPTLQTRNVFVLQPHYRGIFAVEVFDFVHLEAPPARGWTPINLPAGATASFVNPAYHQGDFAATEPIVEIQGPKSKGSFLNGQSRFIGRVWLRREVLWTLLGISLALAVTAGTPIALHGRKLRRFKRGLCTRCAYPLMMEQPEPVCPECGTRHVP